MASGLGRAHLRAIAHGDTGTGPRATTGGTDRGDRHPGLEALASRDGARPRVGRANRDRDDHFYERSALMARILVYQSAASGNVFPAVDMLLELHGRGHELYLRGGAAEVARLRDLGINTAPVDPRIEDFELEDWRGRTQVDSLRRLARGYAALAQFELPDMRDAISDVRPEALVVDVNCHGAMYAAEASGLPWAVFCPYPPAFRSVDAPPHGVGWRPARGPLGRTRDRAMWWLADRLGTRELRPFNRLRAGLGLEPLSKFDDQYLKSDVFIAFTAEPFEYPRSDWPAQMRLVGPGLWEPPADPPAWLDGETRPIVLVT